MKNYENILSNHENQQKHVKGHLRFKTQSHKTSYNIWPSTSYKKTNLYTNKDMKRQKYPHIVCSLTAAHLIVVMITCIYTHESREVSDEHP